MRGSKLSLLGCVHSAKNREEADSIDQDDAMLLGESHRWLGKCRGGDNDAMLGVMMDMHHANKLLVANAAQTTDDLRMRVRKRDGVPRL